MIEIDILPASHETKSGDAILIRIGNFSYNKNEPNSQKVILIDSGYSDTAEIIENHLINIYNTKTIDIAFITHPDSDHISGLKKLIDNGKIHIKNSVIPDPWKHASGILEFVDGRRTAKSIKGDLGDSLRTLSDILSHFGSNNIECFQGNYFNDLGIYVLGPDQKTYEELVSKFPGMPNEESFSHKQVFNEKKSAYNPYNHHFLLFPKTTARNDSSMILALTEKKKVIALFTGDAGANQLLNAISFGKKIGLDFSALKYFQLPHHGSIKNIKKKTFDVINPETIFVSAGSDDEEHPAETVCNYLKVFKDKKITQINEQITVRFTYGINVPARPGWNYPAPTLPKFETVKQISNDIEGE